MNETCETCRYWGADCSFGGKPYMGACGNKLSYLGNCYTRPEETCIRYEQKQTPDTRQSVADELKALGVSEPTEEERFLRREEDKTRRWLRKTDIKGEGGTEQ